MILPKKFRINFFSAMAFIAYKVSKRYRSVAHKNLDFLFGDELSEDEVCDAVGEITNMVMGSVKSRIQIETGEVMVSIPTVVRGQKLASSMGDGASRVVVKVNAEDEHIIEFLFMYREAG